MSDAPGPSGPAPASGSPDEQFVVPLPTQALPVAEPTRALPTAGSAPVVPPAPTSAPTSAPSPYAAQPSPYAGQPSPYAAQPSWWPPPAGAVAPEAGSAGSDRPVDPLIGQVGSALFWITVGWWLFFVVRLMGRIARVGFDDTLVIRTIDAGPEETVSAAVLSVLAALLLLLGRGRTGRTPLGWAALGLAVLTVAVTVWRLLP